MDGLVFIVVIVLFSLLEGVLRKQKAAQQARLSGQAPDDGQDGQSEDGRYGLVQDEQFEATYGGEPSYGDGQPSSYDDDHDIPEYSNPHEAAQPSAQPPSEQLIPKDVWEELAALVSGAQPGSEQPEALSPPHTDSVAVTRTDPGAVTRFDAGAVTRTDPGAVTRPDSYQPTSKKEHIVHSSHRGYGTDPSSRAPSEQDGLDPLAEHLNEDAEQVHELFLSRDPHALRRAVMLQEVLGLPAAFRGDPYDA